MTTIPSRLQLTPEILVPRLGDYLVEKGVITSEQLKNALAEQQALKKDGQFPPQLGQILITKEYLTREDLDQAITEQILALREALQKNNLLLEQRVKERTVELEQALKKLNELTQLKANFVANISHELRTPLTHLKGYLDLLLSSAFGEIPEEQRQILTIMGQSSDRLGQLIEDLILFSTAERGQVILRPQPTDKADLITKVWECYQPKAQEKKIIFKVKVPDNLPAVKVDPEKILWVINQLVDNAIKFTGSGGNVSLDCDLQNDQVRICIMDTGIGIPKERLNELFEPFHQLDGSSTRRYGGTGLGLALTKTILEAHGIAIKTKSEANKGSCFEFFMPVLK